MKILPAGSTDVTTYVKIRLAADGTGATGLTPANFDLQYVRYRESPSTKVDATACAATNAAHSDNTVIEIDATDQPGVYRVDWPDAAFAPGAYSVVLTVKVATAFTEEIEIILEPVPADVRKVKGKIAEADDGILHVDARRWAGADVPEADEDEGDVPGFPQVDLRLLVGAEVEADEGILSANLAQIGGSTPAALNARRYFDGTGYGPIVCRTQIAGLTSQTSFTLAAGPTNADALNGKTVLIENAGGTEKCSAIILDYASGTRTVTLLAAPGRTIANGDIVTVLATSILSADACNRIADFVRRRTQANVESSASTDLDTETLLCLYGLIQQVQEFSTTVTPGSLTVYKTNGTTVLGTRVLSSDASAAPITGAQ